MLAGASPTYSWSSFTAPFGWIICRQSVANWSHSVRAVSFGAAAALRSQCSAFRRYSSPLSTRHANAFHGDNAGTDRQVPRWRVCACQRQKTSKIAEKHQN